MSEDAQPPIEADGQAPPEPDGEQPSSGGLAAAIPGLLMLAAILVVTGWGIAKLAPDEAPVKANPSFIDSIFANVVVIAAARTLLLVASVVLLVALTYIAASVVARMIRKEWLRRAGPFEAGLKEADAELDEADTFIEEWLEASDENEQLLERLEERDDTIRQLLEDRARLVEEVQRLRGT